MSVTKERKSAHAGAGGRALLLGVEREGELVRLEHGAELKLDRILRVEKELTNRHLKCAAWLNFGRVQTPVGTFDQRSSRAFDFVLEGGDEDE